MKKEIHESTFCNEMSENDHGFTYDGAKILWDYLEGFGEEIEFDPVAFRCQYSEYTLEEYTSEFPEKREEYFESADMEEDDFDEEEFIEWIGDYTDGIIWVNAKENIILLINQ